MPHIHFSPQGSLKNVPCIFSCYHLASFLPSYIAVFCSLTGWPEMASQWISVSLWNIHNYLIWALSCFCTEKPIPRETERLSFSFLQPWPEQLWEQGTEEEATSAWEGESVTWGTASAAGAVLGWAAPPLEVAAAPAWSLSRPPPPEEVTEAKGFLSDAFTRQKTP